MYDDPDDLYGGFDTVDPVLDTKQLEEDKGFQEAVRTSYGRRPPVKMIFLHPLDKSLEWVFIFF